ncbi:transcriptional repressor LexA [Sedimentibacter sp. zth1]|uniref:transcriptional repressor LexA n=1 Tax=Sedimentibacter sp. zth1 TaxID=2816908 RepID=UPI001A92C3B1|nr:transcriptional repressor LexA [Sedimentibacter sp. zth1]QSX06513.1 transcriptional repressor LexA [Sedimentibacter sp. zth1]
MAYDDLSEIQIKILTYIKQELTEKGYPPSVREMCKATGLSSTSSVHAHLNTLEKKGYIIKGNNKMRAIELVDVENPYTEFQKKEVTHLPVLGNVAAGSPILAVENVEDLMPVPIDLIGNSEESYILKVKGESMIEVGIMNGDYIIVNKQNTAENGDIVVALIDDSATVKTFYREKDYIRLQPQNSTMSPIIVKDPYILGVVKGVIRKY